MTYKDLIDTLVRDSGDNGADFRTNAYRWLTLVRQEAARRGTWSSAKDSVAAFDTQPIVATGIYALEGYSSVVGDEMYDQTNDAVIRRDTENTLKAFDANANENGPPTLWSDAGMNDLGQALVRFWPIPAEVVTISFLGTKALSDVTSNEENEGLDPYFGALSEVGAMLQAGLRYYHDLNNNEDYVQVRGSKAAFYDAIKLYSQTSGADSVKTSRLEPVGRRYSARPLGRLDPSHFNNR